MVGEKSSYSKEAVTIFSGILLSIFHLLNQPFGKSEV